MAGGNGTWDNRDNESAGAGGGATDIRLIGGLWNNFNGLKSRIMVAGGRTVELFILLHGSAGGGIVGKTNSYVSPGTQNSGFRFGMGQNGSGGGSYSDGVSGGGGGYYGGYTGYSTDSPGAGGSGFISGYNGCDAILEESTENNILHSGQSIHYSGKYFEDCILLDGNDANVPSKTNSNGLARIKYLGE